MRSPKSLILEGPVRAFARLVIDCQHSTNSGADITPLCHIAAFKPKIDHQLIDDPRNIGGTESLVEWWPGRERVTGERRDHEMVRQGAWVVLVAKQRQKRQKLEETSYSPRRIYISKARNGP